MKKQPMGGLRQAAAELSRAGRYGDTMLAHINPEEAHMLRAMGGSGTINPETGMPEFFFKKIKKAVKKVASVPGKIVSTAAKVPLKGFSAVTGIGTKGLQNIVAKPGQELSKIGRAIAAAPLHAASGSVNLIKNPGEQIAQIGKEAGRTALSPYLSAALSVTPLAPYGIALGAAQGAYKARDGGFGDILLGGALGGLKNYGISNLAGSALNYGAGLGGNIGSVSSQLGGVAAPGTAGFGAFGADGVVGTGAKFAPLNLGTPVPIGEGLAGVTSTATKSGSFLSNLGNALSGGADGAYGLDDITNLFGTGEGKLGLDDITNLFGTGDGKLGFDDVGQFLGSLGGGGGSGGSGGGLNPLITALLAAGAGYAAGNSGGGSGGGNGIAQSEYFNRPSTQFSWGDIRNQAGNAGKSPSDILAENWDQVSAGNYNQAPGTAPGNLAPQIPQGQRSPLASASATSGGLSPQMPQIQQPLYTIPDPNYTGSTGGGLLAGGNPSEAQLVSLMRAFSPQKLARGGLGMMRDSGMGMDMNPGMQGMPRPVALVRGGGTGRSDSIDARLSEGEYIMDAETVAMLGDGSTKAGAERLDGMRQALRKHKGKVLAKGKFSPNAKSPLQYVKGKK